MAGKPRKLKSPKELPEVVRTYLRVLRGKG
jgi:hypothetical protein